MRGTSLCRLPPPPTFLPTRPPCAGYLRIFRLLWTIKHVEAVLGQCWDAINSAQRALASLRAAERLHGVGVEHAELVGGGGPGFCFQAWKASGRLPAATRHSGGLGLQCTP